MSPPDVTKVLEEDFGVQTPNNGAHMHDEGLNSSTLFFIDVDGGVEDVNEALGSTVTLPIQERVRAQIVELIVLVGTLRHLGYNTKELLRNLQTIDEALTLVRLSIRQKLCIEKVIA